MIFVKEIENELTHLSMRNFTCSDRSECYSANRIISEYILKRNLLLDVKFNKNNFQSYMFAKSLLLD